MSEGEGGGNTRIGREGRGVLSEKGILGKGLDLRGIYAIICGEIGREEENRWNI